MLIPQSPNQNHLLAALPTVEFERLAPHLELATLRLGQVLCEPGDRLPYGYFPTNSIISLHYVMESGASAEVAGIGNEGMLGTSLFMGGQTTLTGAVVQTAGHAYRLRTAELMQEFNRTELLMRLLLRYTQAIMSQMAQTGACNRHHSLLQQLCRWLLLTLDRLPGNELIVTQDLIASLLGVRREGITVAAGKLKELGAIDYRRGHITVLNRSLINAHVCECYAVVKSEFDRLLDDVLHRQPLARASQPVSHTANNSARVR